MAHSLIPIVPSTLLPGTIVSVPILWFWRHHGIVSERFHGDKPMVISNSARAGGLTEEPWDTFAAGQPVAVEGYPGSLPPHLVLHRARSLINKAYDVLAWNCDHLTSHAHGLEPRSPQLAATAAVGMFALIAVVVRS
jgi:hypothetical protein